MNDTRFNPDDLGFLVSLDIDGDLTGEEQKRLTERLDASESMRADADAMRKVGELVRRWAAGPVEIDWHAHAGLINARCLAGEDSQDRPELEDLLKRWARDGTVFEDELFTADVMRRVGRRAPIANPRPRRLWIIRFAAPLAAAAVLAFAFLGVSRINRNVESPDLVSDVRTQLPFDVSRVPVCIVTFARESPDASPAKPDVEPSSGISFTAFGLATVGVVPTPPVP